MRLLIISLLTLGTVTAQTCADRCAVPVVKNASRIYRFDGSKTNQTYSDQLDDNETVAFVLDNKNPFKYEYKITKEVKNLTLDIIQGFMGAFPSLIIPNVNESISPGLSVFDASAADTGVKAAWSKITDKMTEVNTAIQEAQDDLKVKQQAQKAYNEFLDLTKDDVLSGGCESSCGKAQELAPLMKQIADTKDARARQAKIEKAIVSFDDLLKAVNDAIEKSSAVDATKDEQKKEASTKVADAKKTAQSVVTKYKTALDEIDAKKSAIGRLASVLQGGSWTFFEVQTETSSGSSRNVRWTVFRRNLRVEGAGWEQLGVVSLDLGSAPVSVSVGVVVSTVAFDKFVRQSGSDGKGGVVSKFGVDSHGGFSYGGLSQLNGHIYNRKGITLAASAGFTLAINSDAIEPGLIMGPSFGFRKNTIWITTGLNVSRVSQLGGDFKKGDPIPIALQDPLPVEKHAKAGFAFGISYKIR